MFALAERNGVAIPFASVEEVRAAYNFSNLQDFLDIYYAGANVLQTEADFRDLAIAYFDRAAADGVVHAEIFFDPQTHTDRGIAMDTVVEGLLAGMAAAEAKHGLTSKLILCFLRHLDEEAAFATLAAAEPWLDRIAGVGLDSSEVGHPPEKFARVFAAARAKGLKLVAHAGEEGPPDYVYQALDLLDIDRLDHGNRSLEDPVLTARLARDRDDADGVPAVQRQTVQRRLDRGASDRPHAASSGCARRSIRTIRPISAAISARITGRRRTARGLGKRRSGDAGAQFLPRDRS